MVSFACKKIKFEDLVKCSLSLSRADYNLFLFLIEQDKDFTIVQISKILKLDRTTVQKSMKRLVDRDIVVRSQRNLESGGYVFVYLIKNKSDLKKRMIGMADSWLDDVKKEINKW